MALTMYRDASFLCLLLNFIKQSLVVPASNAKKVCVKKLIQISGVLVNSEQIF